MQFNNICVYILLLSHNFTGGGSTGDVINCGNALVLQGINCAWMRLKCQFNHLSLTIMLSEVLITVHN